MARFAEEVMPAVCLTGSELESGRSPCGRDTDPGSARSRRRRDARVGGAGEHAGPSTTMAWAWPNSESQAGADVASMTAIGEPPRHASGRGPRRARSGRRRPSTCRSPSSGRERPAAGVDRGSAGDCPWWNSRAASWSRICGWASPPIVPNTAAKRPSDAWRAPGDSVCGGRRPGPSSAGCPARQVEAEAAVVQVDPGVRLDEVAAEAGRVRLDQRHADPPPSRRSRRCTGTSCRRRASARCVPRRARGRSGRAGASISASSAAPSASSWSTSGRSKPAAVAASISRWAHRGSSGSSGRSSRSASRGRAEREVALRVRADRVQVDAERRRAVSGSTQSACVRGEVGLGEQAGAEFEQTVAERAAVEPVAPGRPARPARTSAAPGRRTRAPVRVACVGEFGEVGSAGCVEAPQRADEQRAGREPVGGERVGRGQHDVERERSEPFVQREPSVDAARHRHRVRRRA